MAVWSMNHIMKLRTMKRKRADTMLVIDGSNLAHRAYRKFEKLKSRKGVGTGLVYGFLRLLNSYIIRFRPAYVIVCFDTQQSKSSNFRNKLLDNYKGHRQSLDMDYASFNRQIRITKRILTRLGIPVVYDDRGLGFESDDYIAYYALQHAKAGKKAIIISSDKDFHQLINKNIKIFNPSKEVIIQDRNCKELFGYEPGECVDYLSLVGDDSDDIPGYHGIGPVKAKQFLQEFGSIQSFLFDKKNTFKGIDQEILKMVGDRNYTLIDLRNSASKIKNIPIIQPKEMDINRLRKTFDKYTLSSFQSPDFLNTFKNLKSWTSPF